ncbi:hypothetical protein HK405_002981, partial [Cladochytrium tenue]
AKLQSLFRNARAHSHNTAAAAGTSTRSICLCRAVASAPAPTFPALSDPAPFMPPQLPRRAPEPRHRLRQLCPLPPPSSTPSPSPVLSALYRLLLGRTLATSPSASSPAASASMRGLAPQRPDQAHPCRSRPFVPTRQEATVSSLASSATAIRARTALLPGELPSTRRDESVAAANTKAPTQSKRRRSSRRGFAAFHSASGADAPVHLSPPTPPNASRRNNSGGGGPLDGVSVPSAVATDPTKLFAAIEHGDAAAAWRAYCRVLAADATWRFPTTRANALEGLLRLLFLAHLGEGGSSGSGRGIGRGSSRIPSTSSHTTDDRGPMALSHENGRSLWASLAVPSAATSAAADWGWLPGDSPPLPATATMVPPDALEAVLLQERCQVHYREFAWLLKLWFQRDGIPFARVWPRLREWRHAVRRGGAGGGGMVSSRGSVSASTGRVALHPRSWCVLMEFACQRGVVRVSLARGAGRRGGGGGDDVGEVLAAIDATDGWSAGLEAGLMRVLKLAGDSDMAQRVFAHARARGCPLSPRAVESLLAVVSRTKDLPAVVRLVANLERGSEVPKQQRQQSQQSLASQQLLTVRAANSILACYVRARVSPAPAFRRLFAAGGLRTPDMATLTLLHQYLFAVLPRGGDNGGSPNAVQSINTLRDSDVGDGAKSGDDNDDVEAIYDCITVSLQALGLGRLPTNSNRLATGQSAETLLAALETADETQLTPVPLTLLARQLASALENRENSSGDGHNHYVDDADGDTDTKFAGAALQRLLALAERHRLAPDAQLLGAAARLAAATGHDPRPALAAARTRGLARHRNFLVPLVAAARAQGRAGDAAELVLAALPPWTPLQPSHAWLSAAAVAGVLASRGTDAARALLAHLDSGGRGAASRAPALAALRARLGDPAAVNAVLRRVLAAAAAAGPASASFSSSLSSSSPPYSVDPYAVSAALAALARSTARRRSTRALAHLLPPLLRLATVAGVSPHHCDPPLLALLEAQAAAGDTRGASQTLRALVPSTPPEWIPQQAISQPTQSSAALLPTHLVARAWLAWGRAHVVAASALRRRRLRRMRRPGSTAASTSAATRPLPLPSPPTSPAHGPDPPPLLLDPTAAACLRTAREVVRAVWGWTDGEAARWLAGGPPPAPPARGIAATDGCVVSVWPRLRLRGQGEERSVRGAHVNDVEVSGEAAVGEALGQLLEACRGARQRRRSRPRLSGGEAAVAGDDADGEPHFGGDAEALLARLLGVEGLQMRDGSRRRAVALGVGGGGGVDRVH